MAAIQPKPVDTTTVEDTTPTIYTFNAAIAIVKSANKTSETQTGAMTADSRIVAWEVDEEDAMMKNNNKALNDQVAIITAISGTDTASNNKLTEANTLYNQMSQEATQTTQDCSNWVTSKNTEISNRGSYISGYMSAIQQVISSMAYTANLLA